MEPRITSSLTEEVTRVFYCNSFGFVEVLLLEFAYSIADALSLGTECSGTKFAINCSLSADIPLQSAIRIAKFILRSTFPKCSYLYVIIVTLRLI